MSTQTRSSGGGGGGSRNQKKSNSAIGGGGGGSSGDTVTHVTAKKTDATKTEKEKVQPKPTAEQLRIAQITNSNTSEDPQMSMKVSMLLEMTHRSEEDVCCALNECDNDLDAAVNFLLETLPVGAFEKSSKKKRNKAANAAGDGAGGDGEWADANANTTDRREKSRNRSSNRGGRGGTDSRGFRGREGRENERNQRGGDTRGSGGERDDRATDKRGGQRNGIGRNGFGFAGRSGRGGGRMGSRGGSNRGERGYGSRNHANNDDHQEVELWDNTIAQNAEKQQHGQSQDDAWGDWNNEEYEGSLKDSKVFTTSHLNSQTTASVVSSGLGSSDLSAPPGLEHHLGTSVLGSSGGSHHLNTSGGSHLSGLVGSGVGAGNTSGLGDDNSNLVNATSSTPLMYSAAVSNPAPQQQSSSSTVGTSAAIGSSQFNSTDTFSNAASAAATLVQQAQQQQVPLKASATLSAEQSQYFNSLSSQSNSATNSQQSTYAQNASGYGQSTPTAAVPFPTSYANVFGSAAGSVTSGSDPSQLVAGNHQQPQVRRARAKLPPPSKIPASAVEMPGDNTLNNIGYLDVQFGGLDFGTDDSFDSMPEKFNASVNIDGQQQKSQDVVANDYQSKQQQQQTPLSQIGDALSAGSYGAQRSAAQQQQQQVVSGNGGSGAPGSTALDQLTKNDPYNNHQSNSASNAHSGYHHQNAYHQTSATGNKSNSAYQPTAQSYNSSSYSNVQSSVTNSYQPQSYGSYQQNSVNSYQQQQQSGPNSQQVTASSTVAGINSTQNIPVGVGSGSQNNTTANSNTGGFLSSGYSTQQSAYQSSQSVYGSTGLSNSTGFTGSTNNSTSQYSNYSANAKLKDASAASTTSHYESVSSSSGVSNSGGGSVGNTGGAGSSSGTNSATPSTNTNNNNASGVNSTSGNVAVSSNNVGVSGVGSGQNSAGTGAGGNSGAGSSVGSNSSSVNNNASSVVAQSAGSAAAAAAVLSSLATSKNNISSSGSGGAGTTGSGGAGTGAGGSSGGAGGMVPTNIQMVSQYIQTGLPYYQQPVYSYEELQMMQQRVPHVQGYYDLNYTPTSLGAGRDNLGSVAYSTMTDGRFARTDNNSSPVSNVSSTMSQQAGSSGPMLNVPYAYFYGGNVMPGGFQYGTPAIYPQQIPTANTASGGQFPKPSYNTGYGSTSYDTLSQASQDYTKGGYSSSVNQQNKTQSVTNQPQAGANSDITSSMYGKSHVALNKVNSYEKQNFHSGTPPPFNMANTQTAGGTSAQPFGMYLPMPAAGHHNMIHPPIHQMDGRIHNSSRRDSNSTGQRQQASSQSKSAAKQGYSPSYWTGQN